MKIVLITDGIWPYIIGGMQKHSYFLCKYLARKEIEVHLYHTIQNSNGELEYDFSEVFSPQELAFIQITTIPYPSGKWYPGHYLRKSYIYSHRIFNHLLPNIHSYDAIYIQGFSGWCLLNKKKRILNVPVCILNFHGLEMFQKPASPRSALSQFLFRPFVQRLITKADFVQSLGGKLTNLLLKVGIKKQKIIELGIGIDEDWLTPEGDIEVPAAKRKFAFVGRYERRKGIEELNAVLKKIELIYHYEFHFIGPVPAKKRLASSKIIYHGMIKDDKIIKQVLSDMDILVCPSYSEGMPTVILEAMSRKCAVIATDVGAVGLLVNKDTGWLIPVANSLALEEAIKNAIECNEEVLKKKKIAAREQIVDNFTWTEICNKLISHIKERMD